MYAVIYIHSDISFILSWLSQYLSDFAEHHKHALKELLQYMWFTINHEIIYKLSESQNLIKYSDSDYILDKQDRRSILKHVYMLKKEPVS